MDQWHYWGNFAAEKAAGLAVNVDAPGVVALRERASTLRKARVAKYSAIYAQIWSFVVKFKEPSLILTGFQPPFLRGLARSALIWSAHQWCTRLASGRSRSTFAPSNGLISLGGPCI